MGLSIHYKGSLKHASDLKLVINEVENIAKTEQWEYTVFEEFFENNSFSKTIDKEKLFGIVVSPPKCEPLCFTFLSNGKMSGLINFSVMQIEGKIDEDLLYAVATKTQYSGFENHKKLILLLDYVSKKYLKSFECIDEGQYWETRDEDLLKKIFDKYTLFINSFSSSIEMIPQDNNEKIEDYLIRIAELTNKRNKT